MESNTIDKVGASIRAKQQKLYDLCYDYLNENFHKFTEANKIKVSLALASKMAPQQIEGAYTVTKMGTVKVQDKDQELNIGNRITDYTPSPQ